MPDLLQILCAHCNGNQILVTWRYLFLRESNNAAQCTGKRPNPRHRPCFATPRSGRITMPRPNSSLARQWGNITMSHPGNTPGQHPGAAAEQYPRRCIESTPPRARSTPAPHRAHNDPAPYQVQPPFRIEPTTSQRCLGGPPRSPETKNRSELQLFCDWQLLRTPQSRIAAQKRSKNGIFQALRSGEESAIAKKLQR